MSRMLPILLFAALPLTACAPVATGSGSASASPAPAPAAAPVPASAPHASAVAPKADAPAVAKATIRGAIRDGNRPPPALRICAHPVDGGTPTCVDIAAGAASYRIAVAAGRYVIAAQALEDPAMKFAHAERIRCIRAPCPPDTAIAVEIGAGQTASGIDLSTGEALPPQA